MDATEHIDLRLLGLGARTASELEQWLPRMRQRNVQVLSTGDMAEVLGLLRRARCEARPQAPEGQGALNALEKLASALETRFREQVPPRPPSSDVLLGRLLSLAHALGSEREWLPDATRWPEAGRWVLGRGLSWFSAKLLRPQRTFNLTATQLLERLIRRRDSSATEPSSLLVMRLRQDADPTAWRPQTHRGGLSGLAALSLQRAWFRMAAPVMMPALERQRRWNDGLVYLLSHLAGGGLDISGLRLGQLLDELAREGDILRGSGVPSWLEPLSSRGLEAVLQAQVSFNALVVETLRVWMGESRFHSADYESWYTARESARMGQVARELEGLRARPLISIITPTYQTPEPLLRGCIDSVRAQFYDNWELCLADDGSSSPHVCAILEEYARRDERIRFVRLGGNQGIAGATNAALALARGEFVAFLDHDDTLAPHALAENALRLAQEPALDVLFSDEDKLDTQGRRFSPVFKPGWSPELLRVSNYVCHFLVARRSLMEELKGIRMGFDGAQDYDLMLRLSERTQRIGHIPQVLYHWRAVPNSTASDSSAKPAASDAGLRALQEHLRRTRVAGTAENVAPCVYRVRYSLTEPMALSLILTPAPGATLVLLERMDEMAAPGPLELILVSEDAKTRTLPALPDFVRVVRVPVPAELPLWARRNLGARQATGQFLLFAHCSLRWLRPDWLRLLVSHAQRPGIGAVGAKLLDGQGRILEAGQALGVHGLAGSAFWNLPASHWGWSGNTDWTRDCSAVSAACLLISRTLLLEEGGFDERFLSWGADVALCVRLLARERRILYAAEAELVETAEPESIPADDLWVAFGQIRPWLRQGDPFYNSNLSLLQSDGSLRGQNEDAEALACQLLAKTLVRIPPAGPV